MINLFEYLWWLNKVSLKKEISMNSNDKCESFHWSNKSEYVFCPDPFIEQSSDPSINPWFFPIRIRILPKRSIPAHPMKASHEI